MSVVTEKSKCRILKLASMLAVTMGIIMAFYAFYIMSELYSFSATEQGKALYMAVKSAEYSIYSSYCGRSLLCNCWILWNDKHRCC